MRGSRVSPEMLIARVLLIVLVALVIFDPQTALAQDQKQPTAVGAVGRRRGRSRRHARRHPGAEGRRQRGRRGGRGRRACSASPSRTRAASAAAASWSSARRAGRSRRSTAREKSPATMRPDSFWENGAPLPFDDARFSGMSAGVPGTPATLGSRRCSSTAPGRSRRALAARDRGRAARASRSTRPSSTRPSRTSTGSTTSRRPPRSTSTRTARRATSARRCATPISRAPTSRIGRHRRRLVLQRLRRAARWRSAAQHPPMAADRQPRLAARPDDARRRARATAPSSGRPRTSATAASTSGAWARRRAAAPPSARRSTSSRATSARPPTACTRCTCYPRGVALHVRRPQRLPRRPRLLRRAARRPPVRQLRGRAARADRPDARGHEPRRARRPLRQPGRPVEPPHASATVSHPRQSTTHLVVSDSSGNVVSYTFTIESTGGNAIVVPGFGFLMNNELTDFNFDSQTAPEPRRRRQAPAQLDEPRRSSRAPASRSWRSARRAARRSSGTVLQILLERLDLGATLPEAIARPRVTHRNTTSSTAEPDFINSSEGQALRAYGHSYTSDWPRSAPPPASSSSAAAGTRRGRAGAPRRRQRGGRAAIASGGCAPASPSAASRRSRWPTT